MKNVECFKIRLYEKELHDNWNVISENDDVLLTIPCEKDGKSNPVIIVADPFLYVYQDELYLFYEEKRLFTPGVLRMVKTRNLKEWTKPVTVLQEPFHLSYPFVFEDNGKIFMIPETSEAGEVRLYQADDEGLTHFTQTDTLLAHQKVDEHISIDYSDSSVFRKDGKYYLMTTLEIDGVNQLFLYTSDHLNGPYNEHPSSPVCISKNYGRNAGSLIQYGEKLYRVAQDCESRYGDNVHLFEVKDLSESFYSEELVKENLYNGSIPFYKEGGHQLNVIEFQRRQIIATDAKEYRSFLLTRILKKLIDLF